MIVSALLMLAAPSAAVDSAPRKTQIVEIDYRGTCGSTLVEQRKRASIDRRISKLRREFKAKDIDVVFVPLNSPGLVVGSYQGRFQSASGGAPVFNRNFGC